MKIHSVAHRKTKILIASDGKITQIPQTPSPFPQEEGVQGMRYIY